MEKQGSLSTEEKPIIENIIGLFQQLLQMQEGGQDPAMVEEAEITVEPEPEKEKEIDKAVIDETGDRKAEERLSNVTSLTDESLDDLKKSIDALAQAMGTKKPVAKTQVQKSQGNTTQVSQALGQISQVLKSITEKQETTDKLLGQMFEAVGITEDVVNKSITTQDKPKDRPVGATDSELYKSLLTDVLKAVGKSEETNEAQRHPFNKKSDVRKNLTGLAEYVHNQGNNRRNQ